MMMSRWREHGHWTVGVTAGCLSHQTLLLLLLLVVLVVVVVVVVLLLLPLLPLLFLSPSDFELSGSHFGN